MTEPHSHGPDGEIVVHEPAPETAAADVAAVEKAGDAEVEVAKVMARRDVKVAELENERAKSLMDQELIETRARLDALEQLVAGMQPAPPPTPEPEPAPVVIEAPPEEPVAPAPPPKDDGESSAPPEPPASKKRGGFWGPAYS